MTPQGSEDLKQDFSWMTLPSRTFKMYEDAKMMVGTVNERKAVEQAVFLILQVERYEWLIYSWNYGAELRSLIGQPIEYCLPEIKRRITEALLQDDRITAVENFQFQIKKNKVLTQFQVVSIFGTIDTETEVEI